MPVGRCENITKHIRVRRVTSLDADPEHHPGAPRVRPDSAGERSLAFNLSPVMRGNHPHTLARLKTLAAEAEQLLKQGFSSHDIRHACAIARGYFDLARHYDEPVNVEDVERVIARMRTALAATKSPFVKTAATADDGWVEGHVS
jgi:hypothetical protein